MKKKPVIDEKIKPLYDFLNSLDGVETIGSCQGHSDNEDFSDPYITFTCDNSRSLGLIAGVVESANEIEIVKNRDEEPEDIFVDWFIENAPKTNGDWSVVVLSADDATLPPDQVNHYVFYCLSPHPFSYDKVEEIWEDPAELARYGNYLIENHMKPAKRGANGKKTN